jgi:hypothetical protein
MTLHRLKYQGLSYEHAYCKNKNDMGITVASNEHDSSKAKHLKTAMTGLPDITKKTCTLPAYNYSILTHTHRQGISPPDF